MAALKETPIRILSAEELACDRSDTASYIASGGFADIFRGIVDGVVPVAVKFSKPRRKMSLCDSGEDDDNDNIVSLLNEATIMWSLLDCPHVTRLIGVQFDHVPPICHVLATELGVCTLNEVLFVPGTNEARKPVPSLGCITTLLLDCAKAVEFMHAEQIVHNDIKPDNMLIYADGMLKVTDFGLSVNTTDAGPHKKDSPRSPSRHSHHLKRHASKESSNTMAELPSVLCKGNTVYQAPEMFIAPPKCTTASDIYAFGIVMNEALTSERPLNHMMAAMLPVQICGGLRPTPVYGDDPAACPTSPGAIGRQASGDGDVGEEPTSPVHIRRARSESCSDETTKRFRHLIRTCWDENFKTRPHANSVAKTLARLLEGLDGPDGGECYREEIRRIIAK